MSRKDDLARLRAQLTDPNEPDWFDEACKQKAEVARLREAVEALATKWARSADVSFSADDVSGGNAYGEAAREARRLLAPVVPSGEAESAPVCRCVSAPAQCPAHPAPVSSGEAESGEGDDRDAIIEDLRMRLALRPEREIVPAVAVQLSDEADWEKIAALCGGDLQNRQDPSGEFTTTITVPGCRDAAGDGDWLVLHQDGSWTVHGEWTDVAVVAPAPVSSGHRLTEYGTTDCPVEGVRAGVDDDGSCEACGAPVPSGGQAVGEGEDDDVYPTAADIIASEKAVNDRLRADLAARPVLSREALRERLGEHLVVLPRGVNCGCGQVGWNGPRSADDYLDHLADVLAGEQR